MTHCRLDLSEVVEDRIRIHHQLDCLVFRWKSTDEDVLKTPVGQGLAHCLHLGTLDYRLGEVVVQVLCGFHGGCCQLCCLGADSLIGNL